MDYKKTATEIVQNIGGKENISSLTHCITRVRFKLKDNSKAQKQLRKLTALSMSSSRVDSSRSLSVTK